MLENIIFVVIRFSNFFNVQISGKPLRNNIIILPSTSILVLRYFHKEVPAIRRPWSYVGNIAGLYSVKNALRYKLRSLECNSRMHEQRRLTLLISRSIEPGEAAAGYKCLIVWTARGSRCSNVPDVNSRYIRMKHGRLFVSREYEEQTNRRGDRFHRTWKICRILCPRFFLCTLDCTEMESRLIEVSQKERERERMEQFFFLSFLSFVQVRFVFLF